MLKLPVILAVDRAGLVGEDGETHHGIYDVGFLRHAPGMSILCPGSLLETEDMMRWAAKYRPGPIAIRYPRGGDRTYKGSAWCSDSLENSAVCQHADGKDITIITYGVLLDNVMRAVQILEEYEISATVLRLTQIAPLPLDEIMKNTTGKLICIVEETSANCGIKDELTCQLLQVDPTFRVFGKDLGNQYVQHGSLDKLYDHYGLSGEAIAKSIMEVIRSEN